MSGKMFARFALACAFLCCFFYAAPILQSCSEGPDPFSDYSTHPDVPLAKFAAGRLGIIQPTFARSYLVIAYRYASGVPLTQDEQLAVSAVWNDRIGRYSSYGDAPPNGDAPSKAGRNPYISDALPDAPLKAWYDARAQVVSTTTPQIDQYRSLDNYSGYLNCANDAFANAARVLDERVQTFGKDHPGVREWVAAQDSVFAYCGGNPDKPTFPQQAESSLPEILRFDREYQIASAYMYGAHFDEADHAFQHIAAEAKSPWHELASYLVARDMVRRGFLDVPKPNGPANGYVPHPAFDPDKMEKAATYIRAALSDTHNTKYSVQLQNLLDRVEFHLHPDQQRLFLSRLLAKPAAPGRFYQWLVDYTWLLDQRPDTRHEYGDNGDPKFSKEATAERQQDDLTDWITSFQMQDAATDHALQMWRAHRDSLPWLLAVLSKTYANSPFAAEVLTAADRVPASSPAYLSAFYHSVRLRNATHNYKEVRQAIDALLASPGELPSTAKEDILDLRLDAAGDLDDAIHFLARDSCDVTHEDSGCVPVLAPHGAIYLDKFPLDVLVSVVQNPKLSNEVRNQIARNIWVRAVLLGRHDVAQSIDSLVLDLSVFPGNPGKEAVTQWIKQYESAQTPEEKQFAAVFLLQHQIAAGFNMGSKDAWCASPYAFDDDTASHRPAPKVFPDSPFLTEAQRKRAASERASLDNLDSQANYYAKTAIDFALKRPDDPRVPESLSRAVKNTRMNCNNTRTSALSKQAFDLLHQHYSATSWAKNTKYWY
jgi:hypothetical protein